MKNPVLVTGATSAVGKELVKFLVDRGARVRAMVFDLRKVDDMSTPGVDYMVGDLRKEEDVRLGLTGADKVYLITPLVKDMVEITKTVVSVAQDEGVRKIVRQTVLDCGVDRRYEFWMKHRVCDELVKRSMMDHTFIRSNQLMQNFIRYNGRTIKTEGVIRKPCGDGHTSFVDAYDVAAAAAVALDGNWHDGRTYSLTGPEPLSNAEVAAELSKAAGKEVRYEDVTPEKARAELIDEGYGTWLADGLMEMYKVEASGKAAFVSGDVEKLTGRKPRRFEQFAQENASAFR
ncbi:MAG: NmrA family NAD(P)-binding protein [Euryarchaeota archaeon]|nr:NmrA family NAD(P)-binding protein [Euryarchaeota archaeon]